MHFRLMSYNIHKGIGGIDRRYDLGRITETINFYEPDIVMLQEVDDGVPRSRHHPQVEMLAEATDMPCYAYQRNVQLRVGHYGNAILSRFPLHDAVDVDLSLPFKKRRGALIARWQIPVGDDTRTITLANIHLGLSGIERQLQLRRLLRAECLESLCNESPLVIAGDYNDVWSSLGRRVMHGHGFTLAGHRIHTFPATLPLRPLDRVFYRGGVRPLRTFAGHTQTARRASDHLPLIVEFEFTGE